MKEETPIKDRNNFILVTAEFTWGGMFDEDPQLTTQIFNHIFNGLHKPWEEDECTTTLRVAYEPYELYSVLKATAKFCQSVDMELFFMHIYLPNTDCVLGIDAVDRHGQITFSNTCLDEYYFEKYVRNFWQSCPADHETLPPALYKDPLMETLINHYMQKNNVVFEEKQIKSLTLSSLIKDYKNYYAFLTYSNQVGYYKTIFAGDDCPCKDLPNFDLQYVEALALELSNNNYKIIDTEVWFVIERNSIPFLLPTISKFKSLYGEENHFITIYLHITSYDQTTDELLELNLEEWDEHLLRHVQGRGFDYYFKQFPDLIMNHISREAAEKASSLQNKTI